MTSSTKNYIRPETSEFLCKILLDKTALLKISHLCDRTSTSVKFTTSKDDITSRQERNQHHYGNRNKYLKKICRTKPSMNHFSVLSWDCSPNINQTQTQLLIKRASCLLKTNHCLNVVINMQQNKCSVITVSIMQPGWKPND